MSKTRVASASRVLDPEMCSGAWSRCEPRNPRWRTNWGLCETCTEARKQDKAAGLGPPAPRPKTPTQRERIASAATAPELVPMSPEEAAALHEVEEARAAAIARRQMALFVLVADNEAYARRVAEAEAKVAAYRATDALTDAQRTLLRSPATAAIRRVG